MPVQQAQSLHTTRTQHGLSNATVSVDTTHYPDLSAYVNEHDDS